MRESGDRLDPIALDLLARSRLADLRDTCVELATLKRARQRQIPVLPADPIERENVLTLLVLRERDYFHRALALVEQLIGIDKAA